MLILSVLCGCTERGPNGEPIITLSGPTMGTGYKVTLADLPPGTDALGLQEEIDGCLDAVDRRMSTYLPESEVSRFNRSNGNEWFGVSPQTAFVLAEARRVSELSGGAFDVTVGPLVDLWDFGPEPHDGLLPTDAQIAEAKANVGYARLDIRQSPAALRKPVAGLHVDLSAIAKGFAVDRVAELLDELGVVGYMIEVGGEIRTKGTKPNGGKWAIGIETPTPHRRGVQKRVPLKDLAMATSGDYRNFFEIDGKRYSHTIDPRTGRPVKHALASVTVVTESCMHADAMATALMVLGPEEGYDLAVEEDLAALLIVRGDDGFVEKATPAFEELFGQKAENNMAVFLAALVVFAVAVLAMALGVIFRYRCLLGTCGGLSNMTDEHEHPLCDACASRTVELGGLSENHSDAEPDESQPLPEDAATAEKPLGNDEFRMTNV